MKTIKFILLPVACASLLLGLLGCATGTTSTTGRDFDGSKVGRIVKGHTMADEIVATFGKPWTTQPETDDGEQWVYFYSTSTVKGRGFTPGGPLAAILIPGSAGDVIAAQNYNSTKFSEHDKTLTIHFDKQRVVVEFALKKS
jgi:outer membrane protein assembly factor BamE (lipoprotein component of BamABCDE complex)